MHGSNGHDLLHAVQIGDRQVELLLDDEHGDLV